jgi:hypothetical protein
MMVSLSTLRPGMEPGLIAELSSVIEHDISAVVASVGLYVPRAHALSLRLSIKVKTLMAPHTPLPVCQCVQLIALFVCYHH